MKSDMSENKRTEDMRVANKMAVRELMSDTGQQERNQEGVSRILQLELVQKSDRWSDCPIVRGQEDRGRVDKDQEQQFRGSESGQLEGRRKAAHQPSRSA